MRTNFQHAERVQVKVARVTWPGDTCDFVCCLIHLRHLVLSTCQLLEVTHMKFVVARECCRSVSSQSGRQLQLEPEAIPDICHEPHEHVRVNFFWPV